MATIVCERERKREKRRVCLMSKAEVEMDVVVVEVGPCDGR